MKTFKTNIKNMLFATLSAIAMAVTAQAATESVSPEVMAVMQNLKRVYPKTTFGQIRETGLPGIYEVVIGRNIAYVEGSGRYFIFGHMMDMPTQRDLTQARKTELGIPSVAANDIRESGGAAGSPSIERQQAAEEKRIDFAGLPRSDSFQIVKGSGKRRFAVFTDPDCPFCKRLEENLVGLTDATIDIYMFPIAQLHPDSVRKAKDVWCAKDKNKAWNDLMLNNKEAGKADCVNPIDRNVALAQRLGINGTPTLILPSGRVIPGAIPLASLTGMLDSEQR